MTCLRIAGVPCITLAGGCHAHNVGVSLLTTVGLGKEWVAHSTDEYVQLALRAAADVKVRRDCRVNRLDCHGLLHSRCAGSGRE